MNTTAPTLTTSETILAMRASSASVQCGAQELLVEVAGEEVGAGDRHDRSGHQRADGDGREGDADEPGRERGEEQRRNGEVGPKLVEARRVGRVFVDARRQGHVAEQRDQPEDEGIGRQQRRVAPDHVAARRAQDPGHGVRIEEQRERRAERQRGVGAVASRDCRPDGGVSVSFSAARWRRWRRSRRAWPG